MILDGPAVLGLADCRMLGRIVDAAVLVVRLGAHELRPLQRAKAMLEQSQVADRRRGLQRPDRRPRELVELRPEPSARATAGTAAVAAGEARATAEPSAAAPIADAD